MEQKLVSVTLAVILMVIASKILLRQMNSLGQLEKSGSCR